MSSFAYDVRDSGSGALRNVTSYLVVKYIHVGSVILSFALFLLRGALMFADAGWRRHALLRVGPHVVDTMLLASALILSALLRQYPFVHAWLTVKVIALAVYIVLGSLALKRAPTIRLRAVFFGLAVLTFLFIVSVARAHHPLGFILQAAHLPHGVGDPQALILIKPQPRRTSLACGC